MIDLMQYGFTEDLIQQDGTTARVTAVHRERYALVCEHGHTHGRLKPTVYYLQGTEEYPTVGDFVKITYNPTGDSQIYKTLTRKTCFKRSDAWTLRGEQTVAANFDYVFVMQSLNSDFNHKRLERYITQSWQSGATPVVILTKADLDGDHAETIATTKRYAIGVDVYAVSAKTGYGMEALDRYALSGKTIVFLGSSGVGKSSLVNALAGEELMATKEIREDDARGRHTTTHRELILLKSGLMIIDTPGMRELGMLDVSDGLGSAFSDVEEFFGKCRFDDCKHEREPGCAVKAAIKSGQLPKERWDSYNQLKREARFVERKESAAQTQATRKQNVKGYERHKQKAEYFLLNESQ